MMLTTSLAVAILAGIAQAQTPQGFQPEVKNKLDVMFNSTMVSKAGQLLSKAETASQPQIAVPSSMVDASKTYMFMMLDLDVPGGQGKGQGNATRRVLLHAMETGFKPTAQKVAGNAVLLSSMDKGPAAYVPPNPPATDTIPHRYVQMLFEQPASLQVKASDFANMQARVGFDLMSFSEKNKLAEPMAANFFMVDGKASAAGGMMMGGARPTGGRMPGGAQPTGGRMPGGARPTGGSRGTASASGARPSRTSAPFTGLAGQLDVSYGLAGLLGSLALVAA